MIVFSLMFPKPAHADQMTQYDSITEIYLQDKSTPECEAVKATGTAYALNLNTFERANGCWADYGEIYEIQLQAADKVYLHYFLNAARFGVKW